jgi:hypothetical protein
MSTPVTSTTPRQIALRQGLLFGGSLGVLILIGAVSLGVVSAFHFSFSAVSVFPTPLDSLTCWRLSLSFLQAGDRRIELGGSI